MSQENYPTQPTERFESKSLVERFYRQPRIGEDQVNSATQSKSETSSPPYECNFCKRKYNRFNDLKNHNERVHHFMNFVCSVCKMNLQMSHSNMIAHFKTHEDQILIETSYAKKDVHTVIAHLNPKLVAICDHLSIYSFPGYF